MQHGEKSEPTCDQDVGNTSIFEGASILNLKANQSFSLRAECEKKEAIVVLPSGSDKYVQDEVHHDLTDLKFQTKVVRSRNVRPRCVVPSALLCEEIMDSAAEILCSNMPLKV